MSTIKVQKGMNLTVSKVLKTPAGDNVTLVPTVSVTGVQLTFTALFNPGLMIREASVSPDGRRKRSLPKKTQVP